MQAIAARDLKVLSAMDLLASLDKKEIERFAGIGKRVAFKAKDVIMREGEPGDSMYFFIEGEVDVTKELTLKVGRGSFSQAEKSMVKLRPGNFGVFGDMAMFGDEPRSATITAAADCVLYEVKRADFQRLCAADPALGVKLLERLASVVCARLRKGNADILKLSTALSIALSK
jgi:CRP/FNR family transcriptional regulator, cyclic AMP receptor protein